ncbi:hypothetical protein ACIGZJ_30935 [Kitasatospora sp. NPDC052868]|uniref:hypothetical protein n=1 Tax=Kitasatospora sp. NPDC052868 TaxID=3364060 RepID=UPI0037C8E297
MTATPPPANLHDRIAHSLLAAAYSCDGTDCRATEDECEAAHPVRRPAPWRWVVRIEGSPEGLAAAVLPIVEAELAARDAENTRLRAELDAARAAGMREGAAMLRRHCPKHDVHADGGSFISCHCPAADEIDRDADALAARTPTS